MPEAVDAKFIARRTAVAWEEYDARLSDLGVTIHRLLTDAGAGGCDGHHSLLDTVELQCRAARRALAALLRSHTNPATQNATSIGEPVGIRECPSCGAGTVQPVCPMCETPIPKLELG